MIDSFRFARLSPRFAIGCSGASRVEKFVVLRIGPAAADSRANASADSEAVMARSMLVPTARSSPTCTARASVAEPPSAVVATVSSSIAPAGTSTTAVNEPSAASVAGTWLTVTLVTAAPSGPGSAVPFTTTWPALPWTMPRFGDVTASLGGGGIDPTHATTVASSKTTADRDRAWAWRMVDPSSKREATPVRSLRTAVVAVGFRGASPRKAGSRALDGACGPDRASPRVDKVGGASWRPQPHARPAADRVRTAAGPRPVGRAS